MLKEAYLYETRDDGKAQCSVCPRRCLIAPGKRGVCNTRKNLDGKIYSLVYGALSSEAVDPIEKKPLYNFWPGSEIYSIATVGCSFKCAQCQNWQISQALPTDDGNYAELPDRVSSYRGSKFPLKYVSPEDLISRVQKAGAKSLAYTYNEPLIWHEYIIDSAKLAHEAGLKTVLVSNGYSTPEATDQLTPFIDAANIDIKSFSNEFYKKFCGVPSVQPILDTVVRMHEQGVFLELTNLLIPGLNDSETQIREIVQWVLENVGPDTPVHFSAFHPDYKLTDRPRTSGAILERAWRLARNMGLHYVYVGNVRSVDGENTYCPGCGAIVIRRAGYTLQEVALSEGNTCKQCGAKVNIQGTPSQNARRGWWR